MTKDPERYGSIDSVAEDIDDMVVQAGTDPRQLKILMCFFKAMFELAKPFTDSQKKISAPNGRLPVENVDPRIIRAVSEIDGAFVETMQHCQWIEVFADGYKKCKQKLEQGGVDFGEKMK